MAESDVKVKISADQADVQAALASLQKGLTSLKNSFNGVSSGANGTRGALEGMRGSLLGNITVGNLLSQGLTRLVEGLKETAMYALRTTMEFEGLKRTLNFATGDGARSLEWVRDLAQRLGLDVEASAKGFAKFSAAAKGTNLEGAQTKKIFEAVALAASALNLSGEKLDGVFLALSQMISKGKVSMEEMRRQLGEHLPGAFQLAARAMGMSTMELDKAISSGKVMADDLLPRLAAQMTREYGPAAQEAADSTQSWMNRAKNSWDSLLVTLANMGPMEGLKDGAKSLVGLLEDASKWIKDNRTDLGTMFSELKASISQVGGLFKDTNTEVDIFGMKVGAIELVMTSIGAAVAVIRDMISVTMGVLQAGLGAVALTLVEVILRPIYAAIVANERYINRNRQLADDLWKEFKGIEAKTNEFFMAGHNKAVAPFKGNGAVGEFYRESSRTDISEAVEVIHSKRSQQTKQNATGGTGGAGKENVYEQEHLRLLEAMAQMKGDMTAAEQDAQALARIGLDLDQERLRIAKELKAGKLSQVQAAELVSQAEALADARQEALDEKARARAAEQAAKIAEIETQAARARSLSLVEMDRAEVEQRYQIGEISAQQRLAQMTLLEAKRYEIEKQALQARLALANLEPVERARINGELQALEDRRAAQLQATRIQQQNLDRMGDGKAGFMAGIQGYMDDSRNAFGQWKNIATNTIQGVENAFATGINGILSGQMSLSQGLKSIWKGITATIVQQLAQLAAKWIVTAIAAKFFAEKTAEGAQQQAISSQIAAAAGIFQAHSSIPYVGPALAAGFVMMMQMVLAQNAIAAATTSKSAKYYAQGGVIDRPTWALMGEVPGSKEIVAPETSFMRWADNLTANITAREQARIDYGRLAGGYASAAQEAGVQGGSQPVDLRGALIVTRREFAQMVHGAQLDYGRMLG